VRIRVQGAMQRRDERIALTKQIKDKARKEVGKLSKRELWLIGVVLYLAKGSKEKDSHQGINIV